MPNAFSVNADFILKTMVQTDKKRLEVCLAPDLFDYIRTGAPFITVVVDILRATSSICAAFENGAEKIVPVSSLSELEDYRKKGYLVAAERGGLKPDFADMGNSPFDFTVPEIKGRSLVISTTNGTRAIDKARDKGTVVIGSFINVNAVAKWIGEQDTNAVVLCAGWERNFCLEDLFFAGSLIESMLIYRDYSLEDDGCQAALDIWKAGKENPLEYVKKTMHWKRLASLGLDDAMEYIFSLNTSGVIPVLNENKKAIINVS